MNTTTESFAAPWPGVLVEMKDFVDLWFLSRQRGPSTVKVYISRELVPLSRLQPHVREFKAQLAGIPGCRIEFRGVDAPEHRIEIEQRRPS